MIRTIGLLPEEERLMERLKEQFQALREEVVQESFALFDEKAKAYDQGDSPWHQHVFGDLSFSQEVANCALRAVSIIRADDPLLAESLDNAVIDLVTYSWMWQTWRRLCAQQALKTVPERPPDSTGPKPKPRRLSLHGGMTG